MPSSFASMYTDRHTFFCSLTVLIVSLVCSEFAAQEKAAALKETEAKLNAAMVNHRPLNGP